MNASASKNKSPSTTAHEATIENNTDVITVSTASEGFRSLFSLFAALASRMNIITQIKNNRVITPAIINIIIKHYLRG